MRELKYYKELPIRPLNKISYPLSVVGADCYIDINDNKYAFISFRNADRKPFFSLYLFIKEYNAAGTLIKETKFSAPNVYAKRGLFIIPEPVEIEGDCEGIEVFIQLAEFSNRTFYNDCFTRRGAENLLAAPKVTSTSSVPFEVQSTKEELLAAEKAEQAKEEPKVEEAAPVVEEPKVETPKVEEEKKEEVKEEPKSSSMSGSNFYHSVVEEEEKPEEVKPAEEEKAEEKVEEAPVEEEPAPVIIPVTETKVYQYKTSRFAPLFVILIGILFVVALLYVIFDYAILNDYVEQLIYYISRYTRYWY